MKLEFLSVEPPPSVTKSEWSNWTWQNRKALKKIEDFTEYFDLSEDEMRAINSCGENFRVQTTPYYARLADRQNPQDPVRRILMPSMQELDQGVQEQTDPLGENDHRPVSRIIHRYSDRVLFLVTDLCAMYCRYCTRKHFTASDQHLAQSSEYEEALEYIRSKKSLREVILSGGDPLTLGDSILQRILSDLRSIEHVEIIRIGSRMPVVCPMRVTQELAEMLRQFAPVFLMTHFNHPKELSRDAALALTTLVDCGIPVFNQMVLLNGVNNHPAIVQALSRRLLYLRVKPYYLFQCDPSMGTDHLRTNVDHTLEIQRELWGHLSGLAMPNFSLDIPSGGGKVPLVPQFQISQNEERRRFRGWDGIEQDYVSPDKALAREPSDVEAYLQEWQGLKSSLRDEQT